MNRATAGCLVVLLLVVSPAAAALIEVGDHGLLANTPGQTIQIVVSGTEAEQVYGVQFNLQVADGGPEGAAYGGPGLIDGPEITNVDLVTGTIFQDGNEGVFGGSVIPQLWASFTLISGSVRANGLLATVTLDTTGFFGPASWDLSMTATPLQAASALFPQEPVTTVIENGEISIAGGGPGVIPEPSTLAVWSLLTVAGALILRRRKRAG